MRCRTSKPDQPGRGAQLSGEYLFDEKTSGGIKPVPVGLLSDCEDLVGSLEPQLAGEEPQIGLVFADPVGKNLEREQGLGGSSEATETREIEDRRGGWVASLQEALDGVIEPPGRQPEPGSHNSSRLVHDVLRLEHRVDIAGCPPLIEGKCDGRATDDVHLRTDTPPLELSGQGGERLDDLSAVHTQMRCRERSGMNTPRRRKAAGAWAIETARKPGVSLTNQKRARKRSGSTDQSGRLRS